MWNYEILGTDVYHLLAAFVLYSKNLGTFDVEDGEHILRGFEVGKFVCRGSSPDVTRIVNEIKEVSGSVEAAEE